MIRDVYEKTSSRHYKRIGMEFRGFPSEGLWFEEYAKELAEDIGAADINPKWPYTCIDWEQAAEELAQDYTIVDYDGIDYLIR